MDIPRWLALAAPGSYLRAADLQKLFGITYDQLNSRIRRGKFPKHDWKSVGLSVRTPVRQWQVSTILNFLKEK